MKTSMQMVSCRALYIVITAAVLIMRPSFRQQHPASRLFPQNSTALLQTANRLDRLTIFFFAQILVCIGIIFTALFNLTTSKDRSGDLLWLTLLVSSVCMLCPSPLNIPQKLVVSPPASPSRQSTIEAES